MDKRDLLNPEKAWSYSTGRLQTSPKQNFNIASKSVELSDSQNMTIECKASDCIIQLTPVEEKVHASKNFDASLSSRRATSLDPCRYETSHEDIEKRTQNDTIYHAEPHTDLNLSSDANKDIHLSRIDSGYKQEPYYYVLSRSDDSEQIESADEKTDHLQFGNESISVASKFNDNPILMERKFPFRLIEHGDLRLSKNSSFPCDKGKEKTLRAFSVDTTRSYLSAQESNCNDSVTNSRISKSSSFPYVQGKKKPPRTTFSGDPPQSYLSPRESDRNDSVTFSRPSQNKLSQTLYAKREQTQIKAMLSDDNTKSYPSPQRPASDSISNSKVYQHQVKATLSNDTKSYPSSHRPDSDSVSNSKLYQHKVKAMLSVDTIALYPSSHRTTSDKVSNSKIYQHQVKATLSADTMKSYPSSHRPDNDSVSNSKIYPNDKFHLSCDKRSTNEDSDFINVNTNLTTPRHRAALYVSDENASIISQNMDIASANDEEQLRNPSNVKSQVSCGEEQFRVYDLVEPRSCLAPDGHTLEHKRSHSSNEHRERCSLFSLSKYGLVLLMGGIVGVGIYSLITCCRD